MATDASAQIPSSYIWHGAERKATLAWEYVPCAKLVRIDGCADFLRATLWQVCEVQLGMTWCIYADTLTK